MRIRDLPAPVTASKADWIPGTTWIGFSPQGKGPGAEGQCQATVRRQFGNGYIIERVTQSFEEPNPAFADHPQVKEDRKRHHELRDRLVAVHRLRPSARPLAEIIGKAEFERLQDIWSSAGERRRWSVAFPIVESYEVVGQPHARTIFAPDIFRRLYRSQSSLLRPFDAEARKAIADLELVPVHAANAWIAIEDEIAMAEGSAISKEAQLTIGRDLASAMEGETEERRAQVRKRAAWLADKLVRERRKAGLLTCDHCAFDPAKLPDGDKLPTRSCFDVHHKSPLDEGKRYTTTADLSLLCPTCHRVEHLRLKTASADPVCRSSMGHIVPAPPRLVRDRCT